MANIMAWLWPEETLEKLAIGCGLMDEPGTHASEKRISLRHAEEEEEHDEDKAEIKKLLGQGVEKKRGIEEEEEGKKKGDVGLLIMYEMQATYSTGFVVVEDFIEGSPAQRSGMIRIGDRLTHIDGTLLSGKAIAVIASLLEGRPGSTVTLTIKSKLLQKSLTVNLVRRLLQAPKQSFQPRPDLQCQPPRMPTWGWRRGPETYDIDGIGTPQDEVAELKAAEQMSIVQHSRASGSWAPKPDPKAKTAKERRREEARPPSSIPKTYIFR